MQRCKRRILAIAIVLCGICICYVATVRYMSWKQEWLLIEDLNSENWSRAEKAAGSLGAKKSRNAIPALIDALDSKYMSVRSAAARALAGIDGNGRAIVRQRLLEALNGKWKPARVDALDDLRVIGIGAEIPSSILVDMLLSEDYDEIVAVLRLLEVMGEAGISMLVNEVSSSSGQGGGMKLQRVLEGTNDRRGDILLERLRRLEK